MAALHLQPRDLDVLSLLGELGLLDIETLHGRCFPGVTLRRCQQRLRQYAEAGLVRPQRLAVWLADRPGRLPALFTLTPRGAEAVEAATGLKPPRVQRGDPKPETFRHRLAVVKARLAIDDGFRTAGLTPPWWVFEQDRRPDARPDEPPSRQLLLHHEFRVEGKVLTYRPDAACLMQIPQDGGGTTGLVGFWEVDRSTERRAQVLGKLPGLAAVIEGRAWAAYFPGTAVSPVRVFFVCNSRERIDSLRGRLAGHPLAPVLRFATADELAARQPVLEPIWRGVEGRGRQIVPPTAVWSASLMGGVR